MPRSWCRRAAGGLWYCDWDVPADRIRHAITFGEVAASPLTAA